MSKERIKEIETRMDELKAAHYEYNTLSTELSDLKRKEHAKEKLTKYWAAVDKCKYVAPEYPSMGEVGNNGSAFFETVEDARQLIAVLNLNNGYSHAFDMKWTTPGWYIAEPDWRYDHDNDIIYTTIFTKQPD